MGNALKIYWSFASLRQFGSLLKPSIMGYWAFPWFPSLPISFIGSLDSDWSRLFYLAGLDFLGFFLAMP